MHQGDVQQGAAVTWPTMPEERLEPHLQLEEPCMVVEAQPL